MTYRYTSCPQSQAVLQWKSFHFIWLLASVVTVKVSKLTSFIFAQNNKKLSLSYKFTHSIFPMRTSLRICKSGTANHQNIGSKLVLTLSTSWYQVYMQLNCLSVLWYVHNLRRRSANPALRRPFTKTTMAKRAFRCTAPAIWNSLPKTVLDSDTITSFKPRLKTHLFSQAFSHTPTYH